MYIFKEWSHLKNIYKIVYDTIVYVSSVFLMVLLPVATWISRPYPPKDGIDLPGFNLYSVSFHVIYMAHVQVIF